MNGIRKIFARGAMLSLVLLVLMLGTSPVCADDGSPITVGGGAGFIADGSPITVGGGAGLALAIDLAISLI
jgi:hypothetical protein